MEIGASEARAIATAMMRSADAMQPMASAMTELVKWLQINVCPAPVAFSADEGPGITLAELLGEIDAELTAP